jgi:hypothetical protein
MHTRACCRARTAPAAPVTDARPESRWTLTGYAEYRIIVLRPHHSWRCGPLPDIQHQIPRRPANHALVEAPARRHTGRHGAMIMTPQGIASRLIVCQQLVAETAETAESSIQHDDGASDMVPVAYVINVMCVRMVPAAGVRLPAESRDIRWPV